MTFCFLFEFVASIFVIASFVIASEQQVCPWMNAATAAGILDGAVDLTAASPMACEFVRRKSPAYVLRIEVGGRIPVHDKCASHATPLKAIGNEAMACAVKGKDGQRIERVVGRVREQGFMIRISTDEHSATEASLLEKSRRAAEQVAGNLF